jgi:hypothetical protein
VADLSLEEARRLTEKLYPRYRSKKAGEVYPTGDDVADVLPQVSFAVDEDVARTSDERELLEVGPDPSLSALPSVPSPSRSPSQASQSVRLPSLSPNGLEAEEHQQEEEAEKENALKLDAQKLESRISKPTTSEPRHDGPRERILKNSPEVQASKLLSFIECDIAAPAF